MLRRRYFLIFNILVVSLMLSAGFIVYSNRQHISWLKGLFSKAAVSQTYSVTESSPGNRYVIGVSITCSATSDVNAAGEIVGWNVSISGNNLDAARVSTGVKIHVPWNTAIEGTNQVVGSQYYPGAQPPTVVASAETFAQSGYSGSLVQCNLPISSNSPPPPGQTCDMPWSEDRMRQQFMGVAPIGSFDNAAYPRNVIAGGNAPIYVKFERSGDKSKVDATITNESEDCLVASVGVYKMYDGVLTHQKFFSSQDSISVPGNSTKTVTVPLPSCMAQIDMYGIPQAPRELLAEYGYNVGPPFMGAAFHLNKVVSYLVPDGPLCNDIPPALVCSPTTQTVAINSKVSFTVSGGVTQYAWSAPGATTSTGTGNTFATTYAASGNKTVTVTSGAQSATCAVVVASSPPPPSLSCTTVTPSVDVNEAARFSATGGIGTYTWSAPGSVSVTGAGAAFSTQYATAGTKTVLVSSGSQQVSCTVAVVSKPVPHNPVGNFDTLTCESLEGWAYDPDVPATSIDVHVYDGQAGNGGVLLGAYSTTIDRPDVNQTFAVTGAHGFRIVPLPAALLNGTSHSVYVYAIDKTGGSNTLIAGSPKTIQCGTSAQKLSCTPQTQSVTIGQAAQLTAVGGDESYVWSAGAGASPVGGTGKTFSPAFSSSGNKTVTVQSKQEVASCVVSVINPPKPLGCILDIQKKVSVITAQPGDVLKYTITLKNTGDEDCTGGGVKLQDVYDRNITFMSDTRTDTITRGYSHDGLPFHDMTSRTLTWNANTLTPGQTGSITWSGMVQPIAACSVVTIKNTARVTADQYDNMQRWVTSNEVATEVATACAQPLTCTPQTQSVFVNQNARLTAAGGSGAVSWSAPGGAPNAGSGATFTTRYLQAGNKQVTVSAGTETARCSVVVSEVEVPPNPLVCSPATQTVALNQSAILVVSGASGVPTWSAPGAIVTAGTGSTFSTAYGTNGAKVVTVTAANGVATCSVQVTGNPPPQQVLDLAVRKVVAPSLVQVGQTAVFTISVINNGPVDATGVSLTDTLPSGVTLVTQVATQGSFNPETRVWTVGSLPVSGTAELRLTVSGDSVGSKLNTALLTASTPTDSNPSNNQAQATLTVVGGTTIPDVVCAPSFQTVRVNQQAVLGAVGGTGTYNWTAPEATPNTGTGATFSAYYTSVGSRTVTLTSGSKQTTCTVNVVPEPVPTPQLDLAVTKQVIPAVIQAGATATFTVVVTNQSSVRGNAIQYTDRLPSGLSVSSVSTSQGTYTTATGIWDIGTLDVHQSATLTVQVTGSQAGTYLNQVSLTTVTPQDIQSANNFASATLVVQSQPGGGGNPSLVCASGVNSILVGQDLKFYANNASGLYSWSAPNGTPAGGTGSIFTTRFAQVGVQTVTVTSGGQSATCTVTVYAPVVLTSIDTTADLSLTKTASPVRLLVGQDTIFTLTVHNAGPGSPDLVSVRDQLPQGLNLLRVTASQGSYDAGTGLWTIGRLEVGQDVILLITAQAGKVGVLTNTGEVWTSSLHDLDSTPGNSNLSEDDQASAVVTVGGVLPKSGSPTSPIIFFAFMCMAAAASAVQIRTIRIARLQTPLGAVEVPLDSP